MTALKQEAIQLVEQMPEEQMPYIIRYINTLKSNDLNTGQFPNRNYALTPKMKAFLELEQMLVPVDGELDYEKEAAEKAKAHENEINALFKKYSGKLYKCSEFLVYKAKVNPKDVTVDEVNEKLTLMVGKFMMDSQTKKNFAYEPTVVNVKKIDNKTEITKRYGNLLDKYINI